MGLAERLRAERASRERSYVVGPAVVSPYEAVLGHDDSLFSPEKYGDYLVGSNAVYACAKLRADQLSSLQLKLWRGAGKDATEVTSGEARDLFRKVNPFWTFNRLINMTELSLGIWGEAFWVLDRGDRGGRPREIWWAKPTKMRPIPHPTDYLKGYLFFPEHGGEPIEFGTDEVLWLRYPNPIDEYSGLSPIAAARLAADVESASLKANRNMFAQGLSMGGAIMPPDGKELSPEQQTELERAVNRRFAGVDKAHKWGVFRHQFKLEKLGVTPKDAEFLGGLRWSLLSVGRAYGVPPELLGDDKRTYENFDAAMRYLWGFTLRPEALFFSSEINEQLLPAFRDVDTAAFDLSTVTALRADESGLWERVIRAFESGLIGEKAAHELLGIEYDAADRRKLNVAAFDMVQMDKTRKDAIPPPAATKAATSDDTDRGTENGHKKEPVRWG